MPSNNPFETIDVRGNNQKRVRSLLNLLPKTTFPFVSDFQRGFPREEKSCGQIGIYAREAPSLGEKGVMLVVVNEHLFGDPTKPEHNPVFRIPDGASNIYFVPPRQPPLKEDHPFAGVEFSYKGARFLFGYELSGAAYNTIKGLVSCPYLVS